MLLVLWALLWVLGRVNALLAPVVVATALLYMLNPFVTRASSRGLHRLVSSVLAFLVLIGGLVLLGFLVIPRISEQAGQFATDFPTIYEDSATQVEDLADSVGVTIDAWSYDEVERFVNDPENQDQFFSAAFDRLGAVTSGVLEVILVFFLAPVIAFYLLIDLPRIRDEAIALIPPAHREETLHVSRQLGTAVGGFLRGQLFVALIVGVLTSFGFWLIGLDFWLIIGMVAGFLNIIPFVGPWVGGALGVMVGLVTGSVTTAIWAAVVAFGVQQIDNNFVSPTVLRATVRLHPAVVILVLILGGALGGVWGLLLAVPATASVKIIAGHLWRTRVLGQSWEEASSALIGGPPERPERLRNLRKRPGEREVVPGDAADLTEPVEPMTQEVVPEPSPSAD